MALFSTAPTVTPPLIQGDRLSRDEFERRYAAMPEGCQAELIDGIVYMAPALRVKSHGQPHSLLNLWLTSYYISTDGLIVADAPTVRLGPQQEPQPDLVLMIAPEYGGQARLSQDDYIEGAPELVAEIAASTVGLDLGAKHKMYHSQGVQEYLVWRVLEQGLDWFSWRDGGYIELLADGDGISRSRVFPGLWLDRAALIQGDMKRVLAVLETGLETAEHDAFMADLLRPQG
jgi:Uma2 family endonuclease